MRVPVGSAVTSNSGEVVRDAAVGGLGIAIKSIWDIRDELLNGDLVTVLDDYSLTPVDVYAVYHNRRFVAPKVRAWIDYFKTRFGSPPYWEGSGALRIQLIFYLQAVALSAMGADLPITMLRQSAQN